MSVMEKAVGPDHLDIANMLNTRAILLDAQVTRDVYQTMPHIICQVKKWYDGILHVDLPDGPGKGAHSVVPDLSI